MYVDLAINSTGDLLFQEQNSNYKSLKVSFSLSNTKAQKISFNIEDSNKIISANALRVNFNIENKKPKDSAVIYKDNVAKAQLIALKLKTTLGDLPMRQDFGSKISMFRHQNINNKNLSNLETLVAKTLEGMIYNPKVIATPIIDMQNGYTQIVKLEVYSNNNLLLEYKMER